MSSKFMRRVHLAGPLGFSEIGRAAQAGFASSLTNGVVGQQSSMRKKPKSFTVEVRRRPQFGLKKATSIARAPTKTTQAILAGPLITPPEAAEPPAAPAPVPSPAPHLSHSCDRRRSLGFKSRNDGRQFECAVSAGLKPKSKSTDQDVAAAEPLKRSRPVKRLCRDRRSAGHRARSVQRAFYWASYEEREWKVPRRRANARSFACEKCGAEYAGATRDNTPCICPLWRVAGRQLTAVANAG